MQLLTHIDAVGGFGWECGVFVSAARELSADRRRDPLNYLQHFLSQPTQRSIELERCLSSLALLRSNGRCRQHARPHASIAT